MFDINNIVNAAINAAVNARLTEVLQQHANTIAPLVEQIHNLDAVCQAQAERIAALENNPAQGQDLTPTTGLTREEVREIADACVEQAMDHHLECYDHDNYDAIVSKVDDLPDPDDLVTNDNFEDAVREAVGNLSFEVSVS